VSSKSHQPIVVTKLIMKNFRRFRDTVIEFTSGLNIIVGDNDAGKSTVLEAINLALTGRWQGKQFAAEFCSHFINNEATAEYVSGLAAGKRPEPPPVIVELFLAETPATAMLKGTNNSLTEDVPGLRLTATFDPDFADEYAEFIRQPAAVKAVPTEYYRIDWYDFAYRSVNPRALKVTASLIDASRIRLQSGADYYLQRIIRDNLDARQRAQLARSYRSMLERFAEDPAIRTINSALDASKDEITTKELTLETDSSQSNQWDTVLAPHLDRLPLHQSGRGEQNSLKILLALSRKAEDAHVILIEEPENHLSFSSLNQLLERISSKCADRQVIVSTHSSYVLNKLGLERLMLLSANTVTRTTDLPVATQTYFRKLSGYDTLRLVLAKAVILVEGPSDELIVQRAYYDRHGKRPIEDGVDVINVRGLAAMRFLDLAVPLQRRTAVVADNDGDYVKKVDKKYASYLRYPFISVHRSEDNGSPTLEPQMLAANGLEVVNRVLNKSFSSKEEAISYMTNDSHKTDIALAFHDTRETLIMPRYIQEAVDAIVQ